MAKPSCGYESRSAAIRDMLEQNVERTEIAKQLGVPLTRYTALQCSALRSVNKRERPAVPLSKDMLEKARRTARRRDMTVNDLIRQIVEVVISEDMVDAVLDD